MSQKKKVLKNVIQVSPDFYLQLYILSCVTDRGTKTWLWQPFFLLKNFSGYLFTKIIQCKLPSPWQLAT